MFYTLSYLYVIHLTMKKQEGRRLWLSCLTDSFVMNVKQNITLSWHVITHDCPCIFLVWCNIRDYREMFYTKKKIDFSMKVNFLSESLLVIYCNSILNSLLRPIYF